MNRCSQLNSVRRSQTMARAQLCRLFSDHLRNRYRGHFTRMKKNLAVLIGQRLVSMAHRVHKHFRQGQNGRRDSKLSPINSFEEGPHERKIGRIFFDEVDERSRIKTNDGTAKRLYPFHAARSRSTYSCASIPCQISLPNPCSSRILTRDSDAARARRYSANSDINRSCSARLRDSTFRRMSS